MTISPVLLYNPLPAACRPYDPQAPEIARILRDLIRSVLPDVEVEHFGSTAFPDCAGKGNIDLMVLYVDGMVEPTKAGLAVIGFQSQTSLDPFPEERPMRVGSFEYGGKEHPIHAHVIASNSQEAEELRWFRDTLRADMKLRAQYVVEKQRILAAGISDPVEYTNLKGAFVGKVLAKRRGNKLADAI